MIIIVILIIVRVLFHVLGLMHIDVVEICENHILVNSPDLI